MAAKKPLAPKLPLMDAYRQTVRERVSQVGVTGKRLNEVLELVEDHGPPRSDAWLVVSNDRPAYIVTNWARMIDASAKDKGAVFTLWLSAIYLYHKQLV